MGPPRAMLGTSPPPRHGRPAGAAAPRPGELAAGRAPPRGSIVAAAAQHRARPGPGWAWMRARSTSSPSDPRRPMVLVAPPSCVVCRSDMHVHDHFLPPCCSIQRNGQERICFSSQRTQGATLYHHQKFFDWKSSYCRISHQPISTSVNASGQQLQSEPEAHDSTSIWRAISSSLDAFYRFSRPHTVIGTALSIVSVSLLAVQSLSDISPLFLTGLLEAVVAALFMNIYIVGLNQLFDIEIDKVNKPTLPLASGEYTPVTGVAIVSVFVAMSFGLGWAIGSQPLFWALFISFVLGTAYSINKLSLLELPKETAIYVVGLTAAIP